MVNAAAAKTSFHEITKAKIAEAVVLGMISGKTTIVNAVRRVLPKIRAASSSSIGMPENREEVISTANCTASVVCTSTRPKAGSSSPLRMNITTRGSANNGRGKAHVSKINNRKVALPRKSNRDSA